MKPTVALYIFLVIVLVGCTPVQQCPVCNNSGIVCSAPIVNPVTEVKGITIDRLDAGVQSVYIIDDGSKIDVINCGSVAYGPLITDDLKKYRNTKVFNNLIVMNTTNEYIGGCKDLLIEFNEFQQVHVYGPERDTQEYKDMLKWIPGGKLVKHNLPFIYEYNTYHLDFSKVMYGGTITNGTDYRDVLT